ncbi:MAG: transglycosylase domain-containing protein, partial [Actinomycetes bacterium]
ARPHPDPRAQAAARSCATAGAGATSGDGSSRTGAGTGRPGRTPTAGPPGRSGPARRRRWVDYPRAGKRGARRWFPSWRLAAGVVLAGVLALVVLFAVGYALTDIPTPNEARQTETTTVYYADGKTPIGKFAVENREIVSADQIPETMKQAIIAAEDRSFYDNRGVSVSGIIRAFWSNLRGNSTQGGSTITQQYVKNYYLQPEQTYERKIREAFLAIKIDQQLSKDEILAGYLNTIYFGRGAYGVQTASQAYFGKNVQDLTPAEAALLAGIVPAPNSWDPAKNPEKAQARWKYVLDSEVDLGYMDKAARAQQQFPQTIESQTSQVYRGPNGYILADLRAEVLSQTKFTEAELDGGGLQIVTTIDQKAQQAAVDAMNDPSAYPKDRPETLHAALVAIDPRTGGIRAMWGGPDYLQRQRNNATQDIAQAGSTFKPFALVAGLEQGISLRTTFNGNSGLSFPGFDRPVRNYGGSDFGEITLLKATASSVNTVYVGLNERVGAANTVEAAVRAGIPQDTKGLEANPANVLGTASPHPIDMAHAFATFAAYGVNRTPHLIASISRDGREVYTPDTTGKKVFDDAVMRDTTYALEGVVNGGSGSYAQSLDRPAAGKTGTSSDNKSAWFVGYTPQLATAVAMYNVGPNGEVLQMPRLQGREVTGGSFPVRIWTKFMDPALAGEPVEDFLPPANVGRAPSRTTSSSTTTTSRPTTAESTTSEPPPQTTTTEPSTESPTSASKTGPSRTATGTRTGGGGQTHGPPAGALPPGSGGGQGGEGQPVATQPLAGVAGNGPGRP